MVPRLGSVVGPSDDFALVGDRLHTGLLEVTDDLGVLDSAGPWVVVIPYGGPPLCARFSRTHPSCDAARLFGYDTTRWVRPATTAWRSSLDRAGFMSGVERIRSEILEGNVYQANLTRIMSVDVTDDDVRPLALILMEANPAPYSAVISIDEPRTRIVSASPELFIARDGRTVRTSPIKGTASTADGFLPKDHPENIMIVDLARNDLGRVCDWGTVRATSLLDVEEHPGLFHLVSTVEGTLRHDVGWSDLIGATFPPASVTGAPKLAAIDLIAELEPEDRRFYCGAIGWVDDNGQRGELNVAIRTFWIEDGRLHFGTGGGITYGSDPQGEWDETELKAHNLIGSVSTSSISRSRRRGTNRSCTSMGDGRVT